MLRTALRYGVPMAVLGGVALCFLLVRRYRPLPAGLRQAIVAVASLPLIGSGMVHLFAPAAFLPLLPAWVPERELLIVVTGVFELAGAAGLCVPRTRGAAGVLLAVMMVAIFPANVYVAGERVGGLQMPGIPVRTAMQAAYIVLLLVAGLGWPRLGGEKAEDRNRGAI
jgi:uncharacterized membrane protein